MHITSRQIVAGSIAALLTLSFTCSAEAQRRSSGNSGSSNNNNNLFQNFGARQNNGFNNNNNGFKTNNNNNNFNSNNGFKVNNNLFKPQTNNGNNGNNGFNTFKPNVFKPNNTGNNGGNNTGNNLFKPNVFKPQQTNVFKPNNTNNNGGNLFPGGVNNLFNNGGKTNNNNNLFSNGGKTNNNLLNGGKNNLLFNNGGKNGNNNGFLINNGGKKSFPGWNPLAGGGTQPGKPVFIKPGTGGGSGSWKKKPLNNNSINNGLVAASIINSVTGLVLATNNNWNRPGWRPRRYYPGYIVDQTVVVDPGTQILSNSDYDPSSFSGGEIKIAAGPDMPGEIGYVLNGTPFEMKPGYSQKFPEDRVWVIQFRSGDENSDVKEYTLTAGHYRFVVADGQLNLSPAVAEAAAAVNTTPFAQGATPVAEPAAAPTSLEPSFQATPGDAPPLVP